MLPVSDATSLACSELRGQVIFFFIFHLVVGMHVTVLSSVLCQFTAVEKRC